GTVPASRAPRLRRRASPRAPASPLPPSWERRGPRGPVRPGIHHPSEVAPETLGLTGQRPGAARVDGSSPGSAPVMMRGTAQREAGMSDGFVALYIFMLAAIAGHVIISRVPV